MPIKNSPTKKRRTSCSGKGEREYFQFTYLTDQMLSSNIQKEYLSDSCQNKSQIREKRGSTFLLIQFLTPFSIKISELKECLPIILVL